MLLIGCSPFCLYHQVICISGSEMVYNSVGADAEDIAVL